LRQAKSGKILGNEKQIKRRSTSRRIGERKVVA
jgi:hypothetical protein